MPVPDSLQYRIELFRQYGRLVPGELDLFGNTSWLAVHIGQHNLPQQSDMLLNYRSVQGSDYLAKMRQAMQQAVQQLPSHQDYINQYCKAEPAP